MARAEAVTGVALRGAALKGAAAMAVAAMMKVEMAAATLGAVKKVTEALLEAWTGMGALVVVH